MKYIVAIPLLWCALHMGVICAPLAAIVCAFIAVPKKKWVIASIVFFGLSIGWVFLEAKWLYQHGYPETPKTAVVTTNARPSVHVGEIFPLEIVAHDITIPINAMLADMTYDPSHLTVRGILLQDSFADIFIAKTFDNSQGSLTVTGGRANPGISTATATLATVYFQAVSEGDAEVKFAPTSLVLANDGRGSNVIARLDSQTYAVSGKLDSAQLSQQSTRFTAEYFADDHRKDQYLYLNQDEKAVAGDIHEISSPRVPNRWLQELARIDDFLLRFWPHLFGRP